MAFFLTIFWTNFLNCRTSRKKLSYSDFRKTHCTVIHAWKTQKGVSNHVLLAFCVCLLQLCKIMSYWNDRNYIINENNKTAGCHRHFFHLPIFLTMLFNRMKAFFPKTTLHHFFLSFPNWKKFHWKTSQLRWKRHLKKEYHLILILQ